MKAFIAFLILLLAFPVFSQSYMGNLSPQINSAPTVTNNSCGKGFQSGINSITVSGTTATMLTPSLIAGGPCTGVGSSITIKNTFTGQDGTWTLLSAQNTPPFTYTFTTTSKNVFDHTFRYDHDGSMVKDNSGKIWNFWHESASEAKDVGWIEYKTSSDNGTTWTSTVRLFVDSGTSCNGGTQPCDWRNQEAGLASNGNVLVAWGSHDWNLASSGWMGMFYSYYNGTSWASPIPLTIVPRDQNPGAWRWCSPYGATVSLPGGAIGVTAVGGINKGCAAPYPMYMLISCDNGVTLGTGTGCSGAMAQYAAKPIRRIAAGGLYSGAVTNEITLAWVGGNTLLGFMRNAQWISGCKAQCGGGSMIEYVSQDLGLTWTAVVTNLGGYNAGETAYAEVTPILYKPPAGNLWMLVWGDRFASGGVNQFALLTLTFDPAAAIANPNGFGAPQVLYSFKGTALCGYPSIVSTGTNTFLLQWDDEVFGNYLNLFQMTGTFQSSSSAGEKKNVAPKRTK